MVWFVPRNSTELLARSSFARTKLRQFMHFHFAANSRCPVVATILSGLKVSALSDPSLYSASHAPPLVPRKTRHASSLSRHCALTLRLSHSDSLVPRHPRYVTPLYKCPTHSVTLHLGTSASLEYSVPISFRPVSLILGPSAPLVRTINNANLHNHLRPRNAPSPGTPLLGIPQDFPLQRFRFDCLSHRSHPLFQRHKRPLALAHLG